MKRLLLILLALLTFQAYTRADDIVIDEVELGKNYETSLFGSFTATLHVKQDGLLRVMSNGSDYPIPYSDAAHEELIPYTASFYDGAQGYILKVNVGDVIYFYRDFCMTGGRVWFSMQQEELTFKSTPAQGQRLLPVGRAQLELLFNMPVKTSGGTMSCGSQSVQLEPHGGSLYFIYEVKDILMRWLAAGVTPGTPINIVLHDVSAMISDDIRYGNDGTLRLSYVMPAMPGQLVNCNFENRLFKSYWLDDDPEGVFRMTFTKPVSTTNPGYLLLVYGIPDAGDVGSLEIPGKADGNDVVFDLRSMPLAPKNLLESGSYYPSISVRPGGITDIDGDFMYSPGIGTLGSWTYDLEYEYLSGKPRWEVFYEDDSDIDVLKAGDRVVLNIYNYHLVRTDGALLTFDDGTQKLVPLSNFDIEYEINGQDAMLIFTVPYVEGRHNECTITLANLRLLTGEEPPRLSETFDWSNTTPTGLTTAGAAPTLFRPAYDLQGRRLTRPAHGLTIESGRKHIGQ